MAHRVKKIVNHLSKEDRMSNILQSRETFDGNPSVYQEKIAFKMYLTEGQVKEYKRRHDEIPNKWSELKSLLTNAGIRDYSIFFDEENSVLFAVLWRAKDNTMDKLPEQAIMKKWWNYMSDIMRTNEENEPIAVDLPCVFHMN